MATIGQRQRKWIGHITERGFPAEVYHVGKNEGKENERKTDAVGLDGGGWIQ